MSDRGVAAGDALHDAVGALRLVARRHRPPVLEQLHRLHVAPVRWPKVWKIVRFCKHVWPFSNVPHLHDR